MKKPCSLLLLLVTLASAQYKNGDGMQTAKQCRESCVNKGGVFCRNFGELNFGYCCDSPTTSPCSKSTMQCTVF